MMENITTAEGRILTFFMEAEADTLTVFTSALLSNIFSISLEVRASNRDPHSGGKQADAVFQHYIKRAT
ncbi:MAG: hypothetical protein IPL17_04085 [Anaerolineales bacterium]|nr:hypothetical protein [Anaerolineales bacterium]